MDFLKKLTAFYEVYKKAVMAAGAALVVTGSALEDAWLSKPELVAIGAAWAGVYAVWQARNKPKGE